MKTYRGKYDGLCFAFELPDDASELDVKYEVN